MPGPDLLPDNTLMAKFSEVMDTSQRDSDVRLNRAQLGLFDVIQDVFRVSPFKQGQIVQTEPLEVQPPTVKTIVKVVHLPDLSTADPDDLFTQLDELLFERLMMTSEQLIANVIEVQVTSRNHKIETKVAERKILFYLYQCYYRLHNVASSAEILVPETSTAMQTAIVNQAANYLTQPDIYPQVATKSALILDLIDKYVHEFGHPDVLQRFVEAVAVAIDIRSEEDESVHLTELLRDAYYTRLADRFENTSLISPQLFNDLPVVRMLSSTPILSRAFITLNSPWKVKSTSGRAGYDFKIGLRGQSASDDILQTLLGRLLSVSCLSKPDQTNPEFFATPSRYSHQEHQITERNIGVQLKSLIEAVQQIFLGFLRCKETKNNILNWVGLVLYAFKDRSKMWTNEMIMSTGSSVQVSDGFMLNFSNVLLQLCKPFAEPYSPKLLKIDPRYCLATALPLDKVLGEANGINMRNLNDETFIVQAVGGETVKTVDDIPLQFNFMTEIFYATHKALQIGFRSCHERFLKLASDMNHIQRVYEEARMQAGRGNEMLERLQEQMDKGMAQFLSMKAMLSQTDSIELMLQFHIATATWLTNLSVSKDADDASHGFKVVKKEFLGREDGDDNACLRAIPEFVVENISDMVTFVRRFSDKILTLPTINLEPLMTLILVFMGSSEKMHNPHSRARLAEVLECLMPRTESDQPGQMNYSMSYDVTRKLFTDHPLIEELSPTLLQVFVSIEMTGQSVQFEQKFQYRRPMYLVLKYLWTSIADPHKTRMKQLAEYAEKNMNAANPPLFLRFINLLINDAIFLLDEGLNYMSKLKELQRERDSGTWTQQQQANYHHMGRLARFHNVIGKDTIDTIAWITEDIKTIFCNETLVDRVAGMLNYFLKYLVGPKKTDYKVKQMEDFDFKPADIVHDICLIYVHLSTKRNPKDKEFCLALSGDERSYSSELLPAAGQVLIKTGKTADGLFQKIELLAAKIDRLSTEQSEIEINVDDVPEEMLDPIMSTLMTYPVKLPSGYVVDKTTIARHLLSDQTDPFTRQPLNMDGVVPDTELKAKIDEFVVAYNKKRSGDTSKE